MKQVQDAYIVAATRTPIGRSHRGYFRNTRPDELLASALRAVMAQAPGLDPKAVEDVICGCAIPGPFLAPRSQEAGSGFIRWFLFDSKIRVGEVESGRRRRRRSTRKMSTRCPGFFQESMHRDFPLTTSPRVLRTSIRFAL